MINEKQGMLIPSQLREPGDRIDSINKRVIAVKEGAIIFGLEAPSKYKNDEHYWYLTMKFFYQTSSVLKKAIQNSQFRKSTAMQIAMSHAAEVADIEERAQIDGLTGASNRKGLNNFAENLRSRKIKAGIIMIDADDFKKYNDNYGHTKGDEALKNLVEVAKKNIRPTDMIARYGGEEFIIILPGLDDQQVISKTADTIRSSLDNGLVTVSMGVTSFKSDDTSLTNIYERVDGNLYRAKSYGKNVVYNDLGVYTSPTSTEQAKQST